MISGVYKITNKVNGKFYIGSAVDIDHRWYCHRNDLNANRHINPKFQHSWNKYGENTFVFEVLEEVQNQTKELLFERENHYLQLLKPYERNIGYNICPKAAGGDNITHNPNRDAFIKKMREINLGELNPMFGKKHSKNTIKQQKQKSVGRYTLEWFVQRYGKIEGEKKFEERRLMLMNRSKECFQHSISSEMTFKGRKHADDFKDKYNRSKDYFKDNWNEFVELVKSKKYSQRQLSEMLGISRPTLRIRMKEVLGQ